MYIVLMYDIMTDENSARVQRNIFKICKRYLTHIQKSVFEGNLTELK
ncbi:MAG: CRISPR-associated endonuclease Cas2, partial [Tissierellia bacterium]|nr:CRISPR-associated endonuclease Cas2 [Tissierellia bacterium]